MKGAARRRKRDVLVALLFVLASSPGCVQNLAGAALTRPRSEPRAIARRVWVAPVEIRGNQDSKIQSTEDAFTLNLVRYLKQSGAFMDVVPMPGSVSSEDWVLSLAFDRYRLERSVHPAYFPSAIFTFTIYIWVGGPIFVDTARLEGELVIRDHEGRMIAEARKSIDEKHNVSIYSPTYALPSGAGERTRFVEAILADALSQIPEEELKKP